MVADFFNSKLLNVDGSVTVSEEPAGFIRTVPFECVKPVAVDKSRLN